MITAAAVYKVLTSMSAWVQLRDVCVFTGPFFAGNTVSGGCGLQKAAGGGCRTTLQSL
jgi:hypothetical protein